MPQNDPPPIVTGDWSVEGQEPEGKGGVPKWLLGCGCGCLVLLVLSLGGLFLAGKLASSKFGPEEQWAELSKLLPYEERPENLEPVAAPLLGMANWVMGKIQPGLSAVTMVDTESGLTLFLLGMDSTQPAEKEDGAESGLKLQELFGVSADDADNGVQRGFVEIQGRKAGWMYGQPESDQPWLQGFDGDGNVQTFVDLSEEGTALLMVVGRIRIEGDEGAAKGRVTDAEIQALLAPFQVWDRP